MAAQDMLTRAKRIAAQGSLPPIVVYPTHVEFDDYRVTEFNRPDDPEWLALKALYDKRDALLKEIAAAEDAFAQKRIEANPGPYYSNGGVVKR